MARLRRDFIAQLTAATAQEAAEAGLVGLYDRPTLVLDPGVHTGMIWRADVDAAGRYKATGSPDKTVRIWSVNFGIAIRSG